MSHTTSKPAGRRVAGILAVLIVLYSFGATADAQQVQRGEYLARAGDCISCHTVKGGSPYAGGYRLETPFGYGRRRTSRPTLKQVSAVGPQTISTAPCTTV